MRLLSEKAFFFALLVGARLDLGGVGRALVKRYPGDVYVNPEGPLNILRGHPLLNNGMVAKKRKYAAFVRTEYSCVYDGSAWGRCTHTRDARKDGIRKLRGDPDQVQFLNEYYAALEAMFTVADGAVVMDGAFQRLSTRCSTPEVRHQLCALLLVLAGGGDIRIYIERERHTPENGASCRKIVSFAASDSEPLLELALEPAEHGALAVFRFLDSYGGKNLSQVEAFGLHYTDSPGFLIQAYVSEIIDSEEDAAGVFAAASALLENMRVAESNRPLWERFFTTDEASALSYSARYAALSEIDEAVTSARFVFNSCAAPLPSHREARMHIREACMRATEKDDDGIFAIERSDSTETALLNICCCLCFDPTTGGFSAEHLRRKGAVASERLCKFFGTICPRPERIGEHKYRDDWEHVIMGLGMASDGNYDYDGRLVRIFAMHNSVGYDEWLEADLGSFLMALAKLLRLPVAAVRELREQIKMVLADPSNVSSCERLGECIRELLDPASIMRISAIECTELEVSREKLFGVLRIIFSSRSSAGTSTSHPVELELMPPFGRPSCHYPGPRLVEFSEEKRRSFAALAEMPADGEGSLLSTLIRECIERFLGTSKHTSSLAEYGADVLTPSNSLKGYIALNNWMAHRPMDSYTEVLNAADQLCSPLMKQLEKIEVRAGPSRLVRGAVLAESSLVAVLDNILGNARFENETERNLIFSLLRYCVGEQALGITSISVSAGHLPILSFDWLADYNVPNVLLGKLKELWAIAESNAVPFAKYARDPWDKRVYPALAAIFRLGDREGLEFLRNKYLPGPRDRSANDYCKMACWVALSSRGASDAHYNEIRTVCDLWKDPFCDLTDCVQACSALRDIRKPGLLSIGMVDKIFSKRPPANQIRALVRIFALFATADADYQGMLEVFEEYSELLDADYKREYIKVLVKCCDAHCLSLSKDRSTREQLKLMPVGMLKDFVTALWRGHSLENLPGDSTPILNFWSELVGKKNLDNIVYEDVVAAHSRELATAGCSIL
ncbi:hypothetical protein PAPHI01_2419 [Pancytospora philotis]|nr:hypothetical protein PAPHI01_2258 [Pancytospora philotis]KAI4293145.1 hypothetical protein PAPHI01_2419 [Pancytospora philotis]